MQEFIRNKGSDRIQINNLLVAVALGIITVLVSLSEIYWRNIILIQLSLSIPILVTSSLAYSKIVYRNESEYRIWDFLGWLTNSIGYIFIINSLTIIIYDQEYSLVAVTLFWVTTILYAIYSIIDVKLDASRLKEKVMKLVFYLALFFLGGYFPMIGYY